jgi:peptide/nickel transport system substrate-binding protein
MDPNQAKEPQDTNPQQAPETTPPVAPVADEAPAELNQDAPEAPAQPADATVVPTKSSKKWPKYVLAVLILCVIAAGVAFAVAKINKPADEKSTAVSKQDIPQLSIGVINGSIKGVYEPDNVDTYAQDIYNQVYEGLVSYQDRTKIVPLLATSWTNPDSSTWDFNIRQGVKFSNGDTMTADDVVYSFKQAIATPDGTYSGTIKDVKKLGDYKVELTTKATDPFLLNKLTFLMVVDSKQPSTTIVGTGAYKLKPGTQPSDTKIQLVANDSYHGGHVYTRALNFVIEDSEEAAEADLKSGKLNIAGELSSETPSGLKGMAYQKVYGEDPSVNFLSLNSEAGGPLANLQVRQALRDSIDVPLLIKDTGLAAEPAYQLVPQAIPGYDPNLAAPKPDAQKAKDLLTQAGYPNGVTLTLHVSPSSVAQANEIAKQAKQAGFTLNVVQQNDFDQLISDLIDGKLQVTLISYGSDTLDGSDVFSSVIQQSANFKSDTLDQYLDEAANTLDQQKRLDILQKTSKYVNDNVAVIALYNKHRVWAMDKAYVIPFDNLSASPGVYFSKVYLNK